MRMSFVSKKMEGKVPYEPISGKFRIRLDANESPFSISNEVIKKFTAALTDLSSPLSALNRYPDPASTCLRKAFAQKYCVPVNCTVAGNGSDELISIIMTSLLDKGDTLAVADPDFSMYAFYAQLSENTVFYMTKDLNYSLDKLLTFVKKNSCRAVIISNPCNPTGHGFRRDEVISFVEKCPALCIIDEAYMDFWDQSILDVATTYENLIVLRTLSKAYGAAGLRAGFAVGHRSLINALDVARSPYNVNSMTQLLGTLVLEDNRSNNGKFLSEQAQKLSSELSSIFPDADIFPTKTNFVYMRLSYAEKVYKALLADGIAVRYFKPDHLRITASTDEELSELYKSLKKSR